MKTNKLFKLIEKEEKIIEKNDLKLKKGVKRVDDRLKRLITEYIITDQDLTKLLNNGFFMLNDRIKLIFKVKVDKT